jgi:hypothetical protein
MQAAEVGAYMTIMLLLETLESEVVAVVAQAEQLLDQQAHQEQLILVVVVEQVEDMIQDQYHL